MLTQRQLDDAALEYRRALTLLLTVQTILQDTTPQGEINGPYCSACPSNLIDELHDLYSHISLGEGRIIAAQYGQNPHEVA